MKTVVEWIREITDGVWEHHLTELYGAEGAARGAERFRTLLTRFAGMFGEKRRVMLFSVPGRSELAGNHTDHNHGKVIAASIDLDIIAVASPREDGRICMASEGFPTDTLTVEDTVAPNPAAFGTSAALIAGMVNGFAVSGYGIGGFDACAQSEVLRGSGLSSSAAYEVMIGTILNGLYNGGFVDTLTVAKLAKRAENVYFGKPCGLMDQCACAIGGIVSLDFADPENPVVDKIGFDLSGAGYVLCVVNTGGNHADLTADYASVPAEMHAVAAALGKEVLRACDREEVVKNLPMLRVECGDRAVLRAMHFFDENERVRHMENALRAGDLPAWFSDVTASGRSSFCYLQNVYTTANVREQGLSLALCVCEHLPCAAFRVHGGGFAGTIQAYVRQDKVSQFCAAMDAAFGAGACLPLRVRAVGACVIGMADEMDTAERKVQKDETDEKDKAGGCVQ